MRENIIIWIILKQICVMMCFTVLAVIFNHWWIVLFSMLFLNQTINYKNTNVSEVI